VVEYLPLWQKDTLRRAGMKRNPSGWLFWTREKLIPSMKQVGGMRESADADLMFSQRWTGSSVGE